MATPPAPPPADLGRRPSNRKPSLLSIPVAVTLLALSAVNLGPRPVRAPPGPTRAGRALWTTPPAENPLTNHEAGAARVLSLLDLHDPSLGEGLWRPQGGAAIRGWTVGLRGGEGRKRPLGKRKRRGRGLDDEDDDKEDDEAEARGNGKDVDGGGDAEGPSEEQDGGTGQIIAERSDSDRDSTWSIDEGPLPGDESSDFWDRVPFQPCEP